MVGLPAMATAGAQQAQERRIEAPPALTAADYAVPRADGFEFILVTPAMRTRNPAFDLNARRWSCEVLGTRAWLTVEGDALAAPQGRAEDVFVGVVVPVNRRLSVKAGYRFLEGGADVDEVYTFALVHYAAVGAIVHF
jgi:hypothetical protein